MKKFIITIQIAAAILFSTQYTSAQKNPNRDFEISKSLNTYISLFRELNRLYVDTIDTEELVTTGINAMLSSLDPYTVFYPESDTDEVKLMTTGEYGGIGALIGQTGKYIIIREPYTGTPSFKSGLLPGDTIISINKQNMIGKTSADATNILRGPSGEEIEMEIRREFQNKPIKIKLVREKIQLPNIPYYDLLHDNVGYIYLTSFTETASDDVARAAKVLVSRGAESLIIDLRNNGGGLLDQAIDIVSMFVPKGSLVVSMKGKIEKESKKLYTTKAPILKDMPLAILIDNSSASASEIVAGSLQDMDRAIIVGERSFGKGLVQNVCNLPYNTKLKVTIAKYYIPSGRCIQAIDYFNKDGNKSREIPDSLKHQFKTAAGRIVYDGGGIQPDIAVKKEEMSVLAQELIFKDMVFNFANSYALKNTAPKNLLDFKITDDIYGQFCKYAKEHNFKYQTRSYEITKSLDKYSKMEGYENVAEKIKELQKSLEPDLDRDLLTFKEEIKKVIQDQLLIRYYNNEGFIKYMVNNEDEVVEKAIEALKKPGNYLSK